MLVEHKYIFEIKNKNYKTLRSRREGPSGGCTCSRPRAASRDPVLYLPYHELSLSQPYRRNTSYSVASGG